MGATGDVDAGVYSKREEGAEHDAAKPPAPFRVALFFLPLRHRATYGKPLQAAASIDLLLSSRAPRLPLADQFHLGFQAHSGLFLNPAPRQLYQLAHFDCPRATEIDDKVRMPVRKRGVADALALESASLQQASRRNCREDF